MLKVPVAGPDDPLVQARVEALREKGRDPFNEYQVPTAVMMFRQGFGRLIRTRDDWGVVAILDPRVVTKKYGQTFLKSLPDCKVAMDIELVEEFVKSRDAECKDRKDTTDTSVNAAVNRDVDAKIDGSNPRQTLHVALKDVVTDEQRNSF